MLSSLEEREQGKVRADVIVEFLEVAFHSILYYRNVYSRAIFCLKRKYQTAVHVSRHPEVNEYLTECLKTIHWLVKKNGVRRVALVIVDEATENVLEKHCFDVDEGVEMYDYFVEAEEGFREYLLKLSVAFAEPETDVGDKSFRVEIATRKQCSVLLNEDTERINFPWIESPEEENDPCSSFRIRPLKTVAISGWKMNMYLEK